MFLTICVLCCYMKHLSFVLFFVHYNSSYHFVVHFEMTMSIEPSFSEKFDVPPLQAHGDMPLPPNVLIVNASSKSTKSL